MFRKGNAAARSVSHSQPEFMQETHRQLAAVPVFSDVVSGALLFEDAVAVAADALTSGALFAGLPA